MQHLAPRLTVKTAKLADPDWQGSVASELGSQEVLKVPYLLGMHADCVLRALETASNCHYVVVAMLDARPEDTHNELFSPMPCVAYLGDTGKTIPDISQSWMRKSETGRPRSAP